MVEEEEEDGGDLSPARPAAAPAAAAPARNESLKEDRRLLGKDTAGEPVALRELDPTTLVRDDHVR